MKNDPQSEEKKKNKALKELENRVKDKAQTMSYLADALHPLLMAWRNDKEGDDKYYSFHAVLETIEEDCQSIRDILNKIDDVSSFNDSHFNPEEEKVREQIEDVFKNHDGLG